MLTLSDHGCKVSKKEDLETSLSLIIWMAELFLPREKRIAKKQEEKRQFQVRAPWIFVLFVFFIEP
jgi:hypothetical protein